ncbi:MAG: DNA replication/repair protein RecF [Kangiellaceae bacterium]
MYLSKFQATGLRNLKPIDLELSSDLNIIEGVNAAGKSSFLEGVCFILSGRSFRTSKSERLISHDINLLSLYAELGTSDRLGMSVSRGKDSRKIKLNGESVNNLSETVSLFPVQVLSPESYHLIDSGPSQRRKFIDWLLFHVEHNYIKEWKEFNKVLKHRNAYLRSLRGGLGKLDPIQIEAWDAKFNEISKVIHTKRKRAVDYTAIELVSILEKLDFSFPKKLSLEYVSGFGEDGLVRKLEYNLSNDVRKGITTAGPHKADIKIKFQNMDVKDTLSRGQKKILINALHLTQTNLLKSLSDKDSLFIIDDYSSELDGVNQSKLVRALQGQQNVQVLLSCLDSKVLKPVIKEYNSVSMFHVEHGEISKVNLSN